MLVLVTIVVIAYFYYHVTAFLEPDSDDWRALYSAPGHGPYTHLTRPLLAFCARGDWLARLDWAILVMQFHASSYAPIKVLPRLPHIGHCRGFDIAKSMPLMTGQL